MSPEAQTLLALTSLPLTTLTQAHLPDDFASGCIAVVNARLVLLTVIHVRQRNANWSVALRYDDKVGRMIHYQLGQMSFLAAMRLEGDGVAAAEEVEFAYKVLPEPIAPMHDRIRRHRVHATTPKLFLAQAPAQPSPAAEYGFYGITYPDLGDGNILRCRPKLQDGLCFTGEDQGLLCFRTPAPYRDFEEFQGCSGAPILDQDGNLVSLVVEGDPGRTMIKGVNLRRYWAAVLVECGCFEVAP